MVPVASWKRPYDCSTAAAVVAMAVGFSGDSGGHFPFGQHLLDVLLNGIALTGQADRGRS